MPAGVPGPPGGRGATSEAPWWREVLAPLPITCDVVSARVIPGSMLGPSDVDTFTIVPVEPNAFRTAKPSHADPIRVYGMTAPAVGPTGWVLTANSTLSARST